MLIFHYILHSFARMAVKLALNFILSGIKKVLKSLTFNLKNPGGTL